MISRATVEVQSLLIPLAFGLLVFKPQDTEILLGQSTYLNCSTSIITEDIYWYHYAVGATALDKREVYAYGKVYEPYLKRFNIDVPFNGTFNLIITSVQEEDAGRYDCQDDGGFGDITSAQLIVLVADPVCRSTTTMDEVVGPNSCQLEPDKPELSCIVQYRGNIPPIMEWRSLKENVSNIQPNITKETNDSNVTYHLTLNVNLCINGSTYICQTTRSTSTQIGCSLDPIKILHTFDSNFTSNASINEELICSANSSQSCSYKWKWFQDDDVSTESKNASLRPTKPGWHKCEAECSIKKQPCTIIVMYALVYQTPTEQPLLSNSDSDKVKTILLAVLLPLSILFVSVIIGISFRMRKRNKSSDDIELESRTSLLQEEKEWKNAIRRHYDFLVDRMFIDFELLQELLKTRSISDEEMQKIKESGTFYESNKQLLDIILNGNEFNDFIEALDSSGQTHLINYLETDGNNSTAFDGTWPLTENEIKILKSNFRNLVDLLDTRVLLSHLYETGVINKRQQEFINSKPTLYEKNENLLDILRSRSLNAYRQTVRCLHASNQSHIAEILEKGGVVVRFDASIEGEAIAVDRLEEEIAAEITNILGDRKLSKSNRILELVQLNLIADKQGHSVALYFLCHQLSDVDRLQRMTKDRRLKKTIESVFNRLIISSAKIRVQVKRITPEFKQCLQYFKDIAKRPKSDKTIKDIQTSEMRNLPFELLDSILQKSYLERILRRKQEPENKDYDAISQLASVDFCWFQRIRRRKFKKEVWRRLVELYIRREKISSIYRITRQFLEENVRLRGLVNRLKSTDCLTDVQTASLRRKNLASGKNSFKRFRDLISEVVKRIDTKQSIIRQWLCDTKQHPIGEVLEIGGAVVKVEIKNHKAKTSVKTQHQNLKLVERILEIRDKMKTRSHRIEELMGKLKQDDLEILNASPDGDVFIVWIWCKTKNALEKLQALNKSNDLTDIFAEVIKNLSSLSEERTPAMIKPKVNIDFEQLEKKFVLFSIVANFTSRLDLKRRKEDEEVKGVTKLRNQIQVLLLHRYSFPHYPSASHCVILVFEDEIPFRLQKRIEIKEIENPTDIASNETENSLYVLDLQFNRECVWRIKDEDDEEEKIIRWLELGDHYEKPRNLWLTRDGQLMLVSLTRNDLLLSLRIFGGSAKADLRLSIPLPEDIQRPFHAVETSKGNFIISHQEEQMEEEVWVISEVSGDGKKIIRRFIPKNKEQKLSLYYFVHLAVDSFGRVFLADYFNDRVILFDSDLQWNGILIPSEEDGKEERKIQGPYRLFYDEEKKELIVGGFYEVFVYTLKRKCQILI